MQQTLVIIKPDAVNRCLVGEVVKRLEQKGLKIAAMKMQLLKADVLKEHYAHHKDKAFFEGSGIFFVSNIAFLLHCQENTLLAVLCRGGVCVG